MLATGWVLLLAAAALAQGSGTTTDPITGNWGSDGLTYLELQHNGEGVVTGTTIWRKDSYEERARITQGTFDGETGRLTLTGEAKNPDGQLVKYAIDGRLEKGTLTGTFQLGANKGTFTFTRQ